MDFIATTQAEFDNALEQLKVEVLPRGMGRTSDQTETWQIRALLYALKKGGYLRFPISLKKRERPDFLVTSGEITLGVEATEAINSDYARAISLPEARNNNSFVDPSFFKWRDVGRSLDDLRDIVKQDELFGDGWVGESVEQEFAQSIVDCIQRKDSKLRAGYEKFNSNSLLIYHNNSTPFLDFDKGAAYTETALRDYWSNSGFDTVFVLKDKSVIVFTKGLSAIIEVKN